MPVQAELPVPEWETPFHLTIRVQYQPVTGRMVVASLCHRPGDALTAIPKIVEVNAELTGLWPVQNAITRELNDYMAVSHQAASREPF